MSAREFRLHPLTSAAIASNFTIKGNRWKGYSDDPRNPNPDVLAPPSVNVFFTKEKIAMTRPGHEDTALDLEQANKFAKGFHLPQYDLTFFAVGTKVYYVEGELTSTSTKYDTGITLTTGTQSEFEEHNGIVYVTNATDGAYGFLVTRLNGAVAGGAATITTDIEGGAQANVFDTELSPANKYLRINGTNEEYASVVAATGVFTLSGTASQAYTDNTITLIVYNLTARFPKCDKIVAWKESLNFVGLTADTGNAGSSDRRQATMTFTQFATAATSENILKVTAGTSGTELVGKSGKLVNGIATRNYLYLFKDTATYFISVADVNLTSGARPPQVLSENYGCLNRNCAADMGNGEIVYLSQNNRIIRITLGVSGQAVTPYPDESFDAAYSNTLKLMDAEQNQALVYYDATQKRLFVQITVDGEAITLPYNNEIKAWEPPMTGWFFRSYFSRKGISYATDRLDDTVYKLGLTLDDDGLPIECVMATPIIEFDDGRTTCKWQEIQVSGDMTKNAEVTLQAALDKGTPMEKTFNSTGVVFDPAPALGSVALGTNTLGSGLHGDPMGGYDKRFAVYPSLGSGLQISLAAFGEGQVFTWASYSLFASAYKKSALTLK